MGNSKAGTGPSQHKKSKSYINQNMEEIMKENSNLGSKAFPI